MKKFNFIYFFIFILCHPLYSMDQKQIDLNVPQPDKPWFSFLGGRTPYNFPCYFNPQTKTTLIAASPNKMYGTLSQLSLRYQQSTTTIASPDELKGDNGIMDIANIRSNKTETLFYAQGIAPMFQYARFLTTFLIHAPHNEPMTAHTLPGLSCLISDKPDSYLFFDKNQIKCKKMNENKERVVFDLSQNQECLRICGLTSLTCNSDSSTIVFATETEVFLVQKKNDIRHCTKISVTGLDASTRDVLSSKIQYDPLTRGLSHINSVTSNHSGSQICVLIQHKPMDMYSLCTFTSLRLIDVKTGKSTPIRLDAELTKDASWNQYLLVQFSDDDEFITISNGSTCFYLYHIATGLGHYHSVPHSYITADGKGIIANRNGNYIAYELISEKIKDLIKNKKYDARVIEATIRRNNQINYLSSWRYISLGIIGVVACGMLLKKIM